MRLALFTVKYSARKMIQGRLSFLEVLMFLCKGKKLNQNDYLIHVFQVIFMYFAFEVT